MRSTVGPQVNGAIPSAPQWVFSAAGRFDVLNRGVKVPGPGAYEQRSSLGAQVTGLHPSQPVFGMGSSTRDNVKGVYISEAHSNSTFQGVNSPGPATYSLNAAVGRQNASTKANQPTWVFGSSKRFADPGLLRSAKLPAPGAYDAPNGVGPQYASTKRTAPLPGFGTSNRAHVAKLYVSPAHEKTKAYGKASPGPLAYLPPIGQRNAPSFGFGTCDRWYTRKSALRLADNPSPAHYNI